MPVASGILPPATLAHPCAARARAAGSGRAVPFGILPLRTLAYPCASHATQRDDTGRATQGAVVEMLRSSRIIGDDADNKPVDEYE